MPKVKFALESDGPERLEINWVGGYFYPRRNIKVLFDGQLVETILSRDELRAGKAFVLPDNTPLTILLVNGKLQIFRNGVSVTDIVHPNRVRKWPSDALRALSIIDLVMSPISLYMVFSHDSSWASFVIYLVCGLTFLALVQIAKTRPILAAIVGTGVYVVQLTVILLYEHKSIFSLMLQLVVIVIASLIGIQAIRKLPSQQRPS